jgi:2-oxoglutarate dehydrogenase E2 component (dihydrolipoamide succinyltransferase)
MPVSVTMPRLGESVTEGTVTRWLKKEGDQVTADEPLLEVSTDKVDTEIPAPASGVLQSIKVGEDETVEVGAELAVIGDGAAGGDAGGAESAQPAGGQTDDGEAQTGEAQTGEAPTGEAQTGQIQGGQDGQAHDSPAPDGQAQTTQPADGRAQAPEQEEAVHAVAADAAASGVGTRDEPPGQAAPATQTEPSAQQAAPAQQQGAAAEQPQQSQQAADDDDAAPEGAGPAYVTPLVRRLAAEHGVELSSVRGSGLGGRIRKQDVIDAAGSGSGAPAQQAPAAAAAQPAITASAPPPPRAAAAPVGAETPAPSAPTRQPSAAGATAAAATTRLRGKTEKLSRLRAVIAQRMVESLQVSAQLTTVIEVDVTKIARLREQAKATFEAREGVKLSFLPFFAMAAVEGLKSHPVVNSSVDMQAGTVTYHEGVHLGIAVDTERGLLVPVIQDAHDLNLAGISRKVADLAERTRSNKVSPDELGGGTFTLTNTGSRGALFDTPILNQPQVAILGTGAVVKRPVVVSDPAMGEVVAVRSMVYLALTYDHRIVDGADAARFLGTVKDRLEEGRFEDSLGLA